MKTLKLIIILFVTITNRFYFQNLSEEYKQEVINSLSITNVDSIDTPHYGGNAIEAVIDYNIKEAIPAIIENIWKQAPYDQTRFIDALNMLGASETEKIALEFLDSIDTYETNYFTKLELKVLAVKNLFELGNYSKYQIIFDRINELKPELAYGVIFLLPQIIWHVPNHADQAKQELLKFTYDSKEDIYKWYAVVNLDTVYGEEMTDVYLDVFTNTDSTTKISIIKNILRKYSNNKIFEFLKNNLSIQSNEDVRYFLSEQLISNYGKLVMYKFVKDFQKTDTTNLLLDLLINNYSLPNPDSTVSTSTMLDTITSYTNQCYGYEWLKDETYKNELLTKLTNAKNYLNAGDSINCRTEVAAFQNSVNQVYQDSAGSYPKHVSNEGYKFLYYYAQYILDRLPETQTYPYLKVNFKDSEGNFILNGSLQYYDAGWKDAANNGDGTFNVETQKEKVSLRMNYEGASQQLDNVTVKQNTVTFSTIKTIVKLLNSQNSLIDGGIVQYYATGWKEFGTASNGEAAKELLPKEYSFRMNYGGASLDKSQNIGTDATVIFQTTNAKVQLKDSQGNLLSGGTVQYYASGWKEFGTATNGETAKELLPKEYSFRMNYGGASLDKSQNIGTDATVIFQTVNTKVQLKDSQGNLLSVGIVQYYASGWKEFGTATNGEATKELLPKEYSFRMNYGGASLDKSQNIGTDATVIFQTVNTKVQLKDSQGNLIGGGTVQYYASGWKEFGTATNGEATKELLPKEYSFRMNYGGASLDKSQNISNNLPVVFSTVNCTVRVVNNANQPINNASVSYYASGWKTIGNTVNGEVIKELLPKNYSFRVNNNGVNKEKQQDITNNNIVEFVY